MEKTTSNVTFISIPNGGQNPGGSTGIGLDAEDVLCGHATSVHAVSRTTHAVRDLTTTQDWVSPVVSDGTNVYWMNNRPNLGTHQENLATVLKRGGSVQDLGRVGSPVASLALDTTRKTLFVVGSCCPEVPVLRLDLTTDQFGTIAEQQAAQGLIAHGYTWVAHARVLRMRRCRFVRECRPVRCSDSPRWTRTQPRS